MSLKGMEIESFYDMKIVFFVLLLRCVLRLSALIQLLQVVEDDDNDILRSVVFLFLFQIPEKITSILFYYFSFQGS